MTCLPNQNFEREFGTKQPKEVLNKAITKLALTRTGDTFNHRALIYDKSSKGAQAYLQLAQEIIDRQKAK